MTHKTSARLYFRGSTALLLLASACSGPLSSLEAAVEVAGFRFSACVTLDPVAEPGMPIDKQCLVEAKDLVPSNDEHCALLSRRPVNPGEWVTVRCLPGDLTDTLDILRASKAALPTTPQSSRPRHTGATDDIGTGSEASSLQPLERESPILTPTPTTRRPWHTGATDD